MRAVVLHEYGGPDKLTWEEIADPRPGEGEVLIRTAATSVNPVDIKRRSGVMKDMFPVEFPGILGSDVSGVVREVGPGVTGFAPGDRVMGSGTSAYAELVVANTGAIVHVPEDMDLVEAAAVPLVTQTGEQLIRLGTGTEKGQTVLVAGALGSVGRTAVYEAKKRGAVVIAGVRAKQRDAAAVLGADYIVALDRPDEIAKLGFLDAVADAVGGETAERLLEKVKQGGVFASVLGPPANAKLHSTVRIVPVQFKPDPKSLAALAEDVLSRKLVIPIDRMVPLAEAGAAQAAAEKGVRGKILLLA